MDPHVTSQPSRSSELRTTLWETARPIFEDILQHPFLVELTNGQLDRKSFAFYVIQDALYLREFARSLGIIAAKSTSDSMITFFNDQAANTLRVERALHASFFAELGIDEKVVLATRMAPTNLGYTSYLLATAFHRPVHEAVAAILPCYWIYWEVGRALFEKGSPDPLYQRWIDAYGAEEFGRLFEAVFGNFAELVEPLGEGERRAVHERFLTTCRYEWMFWDMGYRREVWPR